MVITQLRISREKPVQHVVYIFFASVPNFCQAVDNWSRIGRTFSIYIHALAHFLLLTRRKSPQEKKAKILGKLKLENESFMLYNVWKLQLFKFSRVDVQEDR